MIWKFISLEWKKLMRSPNLAENAGITVLLVFLAFIYAVWFMVFSAQLYAKLQLMFPDTDPFMSANRFILYWLFFDLTIRHFFQKLPNLGIASLLILNIRKSKIIHYILGRSFFSFLNLIAAFASVPFAITLLINGYSTLQVITWLCLLLLATMIVNFVHVIVTSKDGVGKEYIGVSIVLFFAAVMCLDYFQIFSLGAVFGRGIDWITLHTYGLVIPLIILIITYIWSYTTLKEHFYLDAVLQVKHKHRKTSQLSWVERFGGLAPLMKMDLRLIWRNKRTRGLLWTAGLMLFYGLIFYKEDGEMLLFTMFAGVFMTGIFIYNFGMYVPAWDGTYYRFLMSRDIDMKAYLQSKYLLLVGSSIMAFVLTIPYVYFGWEVLLIHFAAFMYNIGIAAPFMLYYGSFRRKAMDLQSSASFNYQGVSGTDMLVIFPVLLVPFVLFLILYYTIGLYFAVGFFVLTGILGLLFRHRMLNKIAQQYVKNKYKMLIGFSKK